MGGSGDEKQENKQQEPPELSPEAAELEEKLARFYQMMNPERLKNESGRAKLRTVAARYAGDEKRLNESLNKKYGKDLHAVETKKGKWKRFKRAAAMLRAM